MSDVGLRSILYAEDDPDDRRLAEMAHRDSGATSPLVFVNDGLEALDYLRGTTSGADSVAVIRPGILVLDLNMPAIGGLETLRIVRADRTLRRLPIVILTTSQAVDDIDRCYDAGANAYIVKPSSFTSLVQLFDGLFSFWFTLSSLPHAIPS